MVFQLIEWGVGVRTLPFILSRVDRRTGVVSTNPPDGPYFPDSHWCGLFSSVVSGNIRHITGLRLSAIILNLPEIVHSLPRFGVLKRCTSCSFNLEKRPNTFGVSSE